MPHIRPIKICERQQKFQIYVMLKMNRYLSQKTGTVI